MLTCKCPDEILKGVNRKLAKIGDDLLQNKKYGLKRRFSYEDFFIVYNYKEMLISNCIVNCSISEKIKTKI